MPDSVFQKELELQRRSVVDSTADLFDIYDGNAYEDDEKCCQVKWLAKQSAMVEGRGLRERARAVASLAPDPRRGPRR